MAQLYRNMGGLHIVVFSEDGLHAVVFFCVLHWNSLLSTVPLSTITPSAVLLSAITLSAVLLSDVLVSGGRAVARLDWKAAASHSIALTAGE